MLTTLRQKTQEVLAQLYHWRHNYKFQSRLQELIQVVFAFKLTFIFAFFFFDSA